MVYPLCIHDSMMSSILKGYYWLCRGLGIYRHLLASLCCTLFARKRCFLCVLLRHGLGTCCCFPYFILQGITGSHHFCCLMGCTATLGEKVGAMILWCYTAAQSCLYILYISWHDPSIVSFFFFGHSDKAHLDPYVCLPSSRKNRAISCMIIVVTSPF